MCIRDSYKSEKGADIQNHPQVGLSFFWPALERQVIIKGNVTQLEATQSDLYFKSRPRESQLGALVSNQSEETTREALENTMAKLKTKYASGEIPRPKHWGGYRVTPVLIEFWQGRPNRLHDRICYTLQESTWIKNRLAP